MREGIDISSFKDHSAVELALEDTFIEWVRDPNGAVGDFWREWSKHNPHKLEELETARILVLGVSGGQRAIPTSELDGSWNAFIAERRRVDSERSVPSKANRFLKVAAILILMGLLVLSLDRWGSDIFSNGNTILVEKSTSTGQRLVVSLPDGSKVNLNAESSISYNEDFGKGQRQVEVKGEAFFEVTHDAERPFIVQSGEILTVVHGTSFNIRSYPEHPLQIALEKGRIQVKLINDGDNGGLFLEPGEMLTVRNGIDPAAVVRFKTHDVSDWRHGYISFSKTSFVDAAKTLERWYGVEFDLDEKVSINPNWKFHGRFRNKSLAYVLHTLSYPDLFQYKIEDKRVIIY